MTFEDDNWSEAVRDALVPVINSTSSERIPSDGTNTVLITGPSGSGKTHLAKAVIGSIGLDYAHIRPSIKHSDQSSSREVFEQARNNEPCALLFENFEQLLCDSDGWPTDPLIRWLTELNGASNVLTVVTVTKLSDLPDQLRRPGRLDVLCPLENPDQTRRRQLLDQFLSNVGVASTLSKTEKETIVTSMERFSAADIKTAVRRGVTYARASSTTLSVEELEQAVTTLTRDLELDQDDTGGFLSEESYSTSYSYKENLVDRDDEDEEEPLQFTWDGDDDGDAPHTAIQRDADIPSVTYDDIGGLERAKRVLREAIEWPREFPKLCEKMGLDTARGVLLYGPPGNGKTMLAKAIANETESHFISVKGPEVMDKYVGESQKFVSELFEAAQSLAPTVVFIDEIDSITGDRGSTDPVTDQVVNQLLLELDGLDELTDVVVIGATNRPDIIDDALLRPGRLGRDVHVPSPDEAAKREIFEIHTSSRPVCEDVTVEWLVERSWTDVSGAEIAAICETAARSAMRRELDEGATRYPASTATGIQIQKRDFEHAFEEHDNRMSADDSAGFH